MNENVIPFNKIWTSGLEKKYFKKVYNQDHLSGDGYFTHKCTSFLEKELSVQKVFLTHSCTGALEMSAILSEIKPGDEIILPSYTFVSTANAFVLRGAVPIFVDIDPDDLNIDITKIERVITNRTRVIVPVHYAGSCCDMTELLRLAEIYKVLIVEDAAQAYGSKYKGKPLGSLGDFGTVSFHETKNVISGEGGALLINKNQYNEKAEIVREKGTNRKKFLIGEVDKYTWEDLGSSYLPSELISSFLLAQLEKSQFIKSEKLKIWSFYYKLTFELEEKGYLRRPKIKKECEHNGHIFYIVLREDIDRTFVMNKMREIGIYLTFHYIPLHSSPGGSKYGRFYGNMKNTDIISRQILRFPMWIGITPQIQERIIDELTNIINLFFFRKI